MTSPARFTARLLFRLVRALAVGVIVGTVYMMVTAEPAAADNCGSFSDCFFTADGAQWALLGTFISLLLDFTPVVGTGKGFIEAITGRDLITGQELEPWERALGIFGPALAGVAAVGTVASVARRADDFADVADTAADVRRGRTAVQHAGDVPGAGSGNEFVGTLRGEPVTLRNVAVETLTYTKRAPAETRVLRNAFNQSGRSDFLQHLAREDNIPMLRDRGLPDAQIRQLENGRVPEGFQVHHKRPLDDGGSNDFDNLVLIRNDPEHKALTNTQNALTRGMQPGETRVVDFPIPEGSLYP
jgi:hypothetical protein